MNSRLDPDHRAASRASPQYKQIETTSLHHEDFPNLQQFRWGPERIADTPAEALSRLFVAARLALQRSGVQLEVRAGARGDRLPRTAGPSARSSWAICSSASRSTTTPRRRPDALQPDRKPPEDRVDDPRLEDRVADNLTFHDTTESESLIVGTRLRHRHRHPDRAERQPARRVARHRAPSTRSFERSEEIQFNGVSKADLNEDGLASRPQLGSAPGRKDEG